MEAAEFNELALTRELDKVKASVFLGENAPFLGSVMCSMFFVWDPGQKTAATDGIGLYWNPHWFQEIPYQTRCTVLLHELWHVARLHMVRRGNRDPRVWNYACDIRINNDLEDMGCTFEGTKPWKDQFYRGWAEEDIYDHLMSRSVENDPETAPIPDDYEADMLEGAPISELVNIVLTAQHQSILGGGSGNLPGDLEEVIKQFLAPVIPWQVKLQKWMTDLAEEDYSWARPNRRSQDVYLPTRYEDDGKLRHLVYFLDVSGSIDRPQVVRFNSEVKYVWDTFEPEKMTVVLFDDVIQEVVEFKAGDSFDEIKIRGRGGTNLAPVREFIHEHKPTAAIIFTDLEVEPMEPLEYDLPLLWVCIRNPSKTVPFGELIHIRG